MSRTENAPDRLPGRLRYARQERLREIGPGGQARLAHAHAVIVGVGALGSQIAELLCRAGVGRLTLIDPDVVDITNLQRQCLYAETDVGAPKVLAAQARLAQINSQVEITAHCTEFDARFMAETGLADDVGVLLDGLDQLDTRLMLNDLAQERGIPYVYGAALGMEGCCFTVLPGQGACLHCLLQSPAAHMSQATCAMAGVLGSTIAMVAALQCAEAIKILVGEPGACSPSLHHFNLWDNVHLDLPVERLHDCPACVQRGARHEVQAQSRALCGRNAIQLLLRPTPDASLAALAQVYGDSVRAHTPHHLEVWRQHEGRELRLTFFNDGRLILDGSRDPALASAVLPPTLELL